MLHNAAMQEYIRLAPHLHLASIQVGAERVGQTLDELGLIERFELRCLGTVRDGTYMDCAENATLAEGDALLVVGTREHMRAFAEKL